MGAAETQLYASTQCCSFAASTPSSGPTPDSSLFLFMQVKNFGRSGRTKYTHLLDQDTTRADDPLFTVLKDEARKRERATGGAAEFSKPKKFIR